MPGGVSEGAEAMQDGFVESKDLGHIWIHMQGIRVAAQSVEQCLIRIDFLFHLKVRLSIGRNVHGLASSALTAPSAGSANDSGKLVDDHEIAIFIVGLGLVGDDGVLALVENALDPALVRQGGVPGQRPHELGVLLPVQETVNAEIEARSRFASLGHFDDLIDGRNDAVAGQRLEALAVHLIDQLQICVVVWIFARTNTQRVKSEVSLVVAGIGGLKLVAQC